MASARASDAELAVILEEEGQTELLVASPVLTQTRRLAAIRAAAFLAAASAAVALAYAAATGIAGSPAALVTTPPRARDSVISLKEKDAGAEDEADKPVFKKCLCVFDIDRTLTGKQGWKDKCPKDTELAGVPDEAYAKGTLVVSQLATSVGATFCGECYHGIVTAGIASGVNSPEREHLLKYIGGTARTRSDFWQDIQFKPDTKVVSSLVVQASDTLKQKSVRSMVDWWREKQGIDFADEDVYFFDDIKENVLPFKGTGFNARQVSCASRGPIELPGAYDGKIGGCGGAFDDVKKVKGVHVCDE